MARAGATGERLEQLCAEGERGVVVVIPEALQVLVGGVAPVEALAEGV